MSNLIVLTDGFPIGNSETFLETEIKYYNGFDTVYIIPLGYNKQEKIRPLLNQRLLKIRFNKTILLRYSTIVPFKKEFYNEIKYLYLKKKLNLRNLKRIFVFYSKTLYFVAKIPKYIELHKDDIVYSYWMTNGAHIGIKLKKKYNIQCVSRAHGHDLYEERYPGGYIPFREETLNTLDRIFAVSYEGKKYLLDNYSYLYKQSEKILVNYLGSKRTKFKNIQINKELNILSCSSIIPIKRLDKIIEVLKSVLNIHINWYHIGNGYMKDEIFKQIENLPKNIQFCWLGELKNEDVFKIYEKYDIHLFINTSDSEGIPVSIMEAMSFGTPVIATNVGGVCEIVNESIGLLLEKNFECNVVVKYIEYIFNMDKLDYMNIRKKAYKNWDKNFNSEINYKEFNKELLSYERSENSERS